MGTNFIGLDTAKTEKLASTLNELLSNYQIFYMNVRGYHWNVKGQQFFQLHEKFVYRTSRPSAVDHIIAKMCAMAAEQRRVPAPVPVFFGYENKSNATLVTPPMCVPRGLEPYYEAIRLRHKNPLHDSWFSDRAFGRR